MDTDATLRRLTTARVLRGAARDTTTLPTFARACEVAAQGWGPLWGFHARLVAKGQVASAIVLRDELNDRETIGRVLSMDECRAREALDAWIEDFEESMRSGR